MRSARAPDDRGIKMVKIDLPSTICLLAGQMSPHVRNVALYSAIENLKLIEFDRD
jgi:hypothetical protein